MLGRSWREEGRLHCPVHVKHSRNILCIFPAYAPSFGTFAHAFALVPGVRAFMPPQGLLIVAAYLPERWQVRYVDENIERAGLSDFAWADVVFVGGMHIQLSEVRDIQRRANRVANSRFSEVQPFQVVLRPTRSSTTCTLVKLVTRLMS